MVGAAGLAQAVENLAAQMLDDGLQTLTLRDYDEDTAVRTYASCRLDGIEPGPTPAGSQANLDNALTFTFTSTTDPA